MTEDGTIWNFEEMPVRKDMTLIAQWEWIPHEEHDWSDACDTTCNTEGCGFVRVAPHNYDSICDTECNDCGYFRDALVPHIDTNTDGKCDECNEAVA